MAQQRFSFLSSRFPDFSLTAIGTILISGLALGLGEAFIVMLNPLVGLACVAIITLIMLFFTRPELAFPLYILVAAPTYILSVGSSGILSRLYIGDLLFALIIIIWLLREISSKSKTRPEREDMRILAPLICLAVIGLISIISSHLFPDPHVTYAFVHSDVSILVVNLVEMFLLISLPLFIIIVPVMVRTRRDARWMIGAYLVVGLPYALGTIFAGPLHLYSQATILGAQRPEVFGASSSGLGILNALFACLAFGQMLYAKKEAVRLGFGLLVSIYTGGVVMSFGREAWVGLLLAVWVILWFRFKSPIALLFPLALLPLMLLIFPDIINFFNPAKVYGIDRINIWQDAIAIWQRSPYTGVGAGNYQFFDLAYGTDVVGMAHNQFLEVLAEMGVQGFIFLLVTIIMIGRAALKRFKTATSSLGKALSLAYLGYFAALLFATFFTDSFVPSTASGGGTGAFIGASYLWLFLGLVLSIPNWDQEAALSESRNVAQQ